MKLVAAILVQTSLLVALAFAQGLVPVHDGGLIDIALIYSLPDGKKNQALNLSRKRLYDGNAQIAYLHPEAARRLKLAANRMGILYDMAYSLRVYDAYRKPAAHNVLAGLEGMKEIAKASSAHTQGKAVDVTLANADGWSLDMGTLVNDMNDCSFIEYELGCRARGQLSNNHLKNRRILREIMQKEGGFCQPPGTGWWHFELCD
jgi:D-alanyl-D-alanine dipeptidase